MNDIFRKECEELGIDFNDFPFDFSEGSTANLASVTRAMFWILKKRQDIISRR